MAVRLAVQLSRNKHIVRKIVAIAAERIVEVRLGLFYPAADLVGAFSENVRRRGFQLSDRLAGRKFDVHISECHSPASTTYISTIGFSMNAFKLSITL